MSKAALENLEKLKLSLESATQELEEFSAQSIPDFSPSGLLDYEDKHIQLHRRVADIRLAIAIQEHSLSENGAKQEREFILQCRGKYRDMGWRPHQITFAGGNKALIFLRYFARKCAPGKGFTPLLLLGGLGYRTTPLLASRAAMFAAALSSYQEARSVLEAIGIDLDVKAIRRITSALGRQAAAERDRLAHSDDPISSEEKPRRVVLSTDGGRIRIRRTKSGPKGKKGRSRYHSDWREPKLIIIFFVDDKGRQCTSSPPIIDTTLEGPDAAFALLASYLKQIDTETAQFSFISDGAKWIWQRVSGLFQSLGIGASRIALTLDFYHAAEHLVSFAKNRSGWTASERSRWINKTKKWLKVGKSAELIQELKDQAKRRRCKQLRTEIAYFESHANHLDYASSRRLGLPIGSGAVESAIRRVINLKLKSPGIHWSKEGASTMLLLRSFFKAGRWSSLAKTAMNAGVGPCEVGNAQ